MTEITKDRPSLPENIDEDKNKVFGKTNAKLIASAFIFGVVFSYLFTRQTVGLNMLLFVLAIYAFAYCNKGIFIKKTFKQEPAMYIFSVCGGFSCRKYVLCAVCDRWTQRGCHPCVVVYAISCFVTKRASFLVSATFPHRYIFWRTQSFNVWHGILFFWRGKHGL